jgi:hypothetical protein
MTPNEDVSITEVIWPVLKQENDYEWWRHKDLHGGNCGLFKVNKNKVKGKNVPVLNWLVTTPWSRMW